MKLVESITRFFSELFDNSDIETIQTKDSVQPSIRVHYTELFTVEVPPSKFEIDAKSFYLVRKNGKSLWAMFICPCGCLELITISLQPIHSPHWRITQSQNSEVTLYPSIWREKGCLSHFWIRNGGIIWCKDTGSYPKNLSQKNRR